VNAIRKLTHEIVESGVRNAKFAIVLGQDVCRTEVSVINTLSVKVADSRSDLHDLIQFVGIRVPLVMVDDVSVPVVGNFERWRGTVVRLYGYKRTEVFVRQRQPDRKFVSEQLTTRMP